MIFALDYDGTYDRAPELWDSFIAAAHKHGHQVLCVTMRHEHEAVAMPIEVIYTGRRAKAAHMETIGRSIDVWIDDKPGWIFCNG